MRRWTAWLGAVMLATAIALPAVAEPGTQGYPHGPGMMWNGGWGGWFIGPIMMLIFLAAAVAVVVLVVRWLGGVGHGAAHGRERRPGGSALEILEERFARGEIDEAEFRKRKQTLSE